jgi:hypothetical protein
MYSSFHYFLSNLFLKVLGEEHEDVAKLLMMLAILHQKEYCDFEDEEAESFYRESLAIRRKVCVICYTVFVYNCFARFGRGSTLM